MRILIIQSSTQRHDPDLQQSHKARKFYFDYDLWFIVTELHCSQQRSYLILLLIFLKNKLSLLLLSTRECFASCSLQVFGVKAKVIPIKLFA